MQKIVVPGEKIADAQLRLDDGLVENNATYSTVIGIYDDERKTLIPLEGLWYPRRDDRVVGVIEEDKLNTYVVNLNAPYKGLIISKFVDTPLAAGDSIEAMIKEVDKTKTAILMRPRRLAGGKVMMVRPSKVPRIIGKNDTMIKQIMDFTKSTIVIGLNGVVWMKGGNVDLATAAILKIEEEAHTSGLTERVREMLQKGAL
ncbi:MAG: hypothetical protein KGI00_00505 [Candidatus Micrarchaeota archaeon]|nr:hypothetical protein [Candidatus Micrarchaeota archaeon]MDE1823719.1 hypothetical protein [Candidatus Micrarchaeota archaeon]MDE1849193.1 hypothetical protein [Candidatus Micrarchaeota archaeon]